MIDLSNPNRDELVAKWRHVIDAIGPANKWDTHAELAWICEAASRIGDGSYLEVGAYCGASMKAVMLANRDIQAVCLDTWDDAGSEEAFKALLWKELKVGRVNAFKCDSRSGFSIIESHSRFNLAFIDGGHLYDDVKGDVEDALDLMLPGGILAGHDYRHNLPDDGVTKAVRELLPNHFLPVDSIWYHQCP
jgi:predicted O-methyltransferase YrrM